VSGGQRYAPILARLLGDAHRAFGAPPLLVGSNPRGASLRESRGLASRHPTRDKQKGPTGMSGDRKSNRGRCRVEGLWWRNLGRGGDGCSALPVVWGGGAARRGGGMRGWVRLMRGWAVRVQAAAGPGPSGRRGVGSRGPGPVVARQALVEGVAAGGRMAARVPRRGWIDGHQLGLRRAPGRADRWRMLRDAQVPEDRAHDPGIGQEREDAHVAMAARTPQRVHLVDACEQVRPATARAPMGSVTACGAERVGAPIELGAARSFVLTPVARRLPPPFGVRGEDPVVAVAADSGRGDEACESVEQFQGLTRIALRPSCAGRGSS